MCNGFFEFLDRRLTSGQRGLLVLPIALGAIALATPYIIYLTWPRAVQSR